MSQNNSTEKQQVTIIGAGLTGLTLAFYLKKSGISVTVIEKDSKPGGVIQTYTDQGFIFEGGPNTGVVGNPEVAELFEDLTNHCSLEIADAKAKRRLILKNNIWEPLPSGLVSAVKTPLFRFRDKIRILGEPFRKKGTDPMESVANMVRRRLGKSFLDYAVNPFISGVYAGNPETLITKYALPKLYNLEQNYGSFIKGSVKRMREPKETRMKKATREVFSASGGLGKLIKGLVNEIGQDCLKLNSEIQNITFSGNRYVIEYQNNEKKSSFISDFLITTCNASALPKVLNFIETSRLNPISILNYAKVVQVILGYKNWKGVSINAFGGLVPEKENRKILGILFTSSFFRNRAPKDGAILSVFMGGTRNPELYDENDQIIEQTALKEVNELMKLSDNKPDLVRIFRYKRAIPQYEASSKERLECIELLQKEYKGLILAGGIRDGIGMADRIKQAKSIADEIILQNI